MGGDFDPLLRKHGCIFLGGVSRFLPGTYSFLREWPSLLLMFGHETLEILDRPF